MQENSVVGKDAKYDVVIGGILFLIVFISKANVLNLPYHWDEMGAFVVPAHWLAEGSLLRVLPGLHPPEVFFGHPPGFHLTLALFFKVFGEKIWLPHLFMAGFSFLGVYFTYLLSSHLFDRVTGLLASLLLFFTPLYFTLSGIAYPELLVASLGIMCVYFMLKERYMAYLACGLYLFTIKESAAAILFAIMLYSYLQDRTRPDVKIKTLKYAVPFILLCVFFIVQKITTGMFLPNTYFDSNPFLRPNFDSIKWAFYKQGRIILTSLIVLNLLINKKTIVRKKEIALFMMIFLFFVGTFSFIYFGGRYILPVLPYFCILGAYSVVQLFKDSRLRIAIVIVILAVFIGKTYSSKKHSGGFDTDMQYVDVVRTHKETCQYIEETFPGKTVLAEWPVSVALKYPYLGYVNKPVKVVRVDEPCDIIIYTLQGHPNNRKIKEIINQQNLSPHKIIENNGKRDEIYLTKSY